MFTGTGPAIARVLGADGEEAWPLGRGGCVLDKFGIDPFADHDAGRAMRVCPGQKFLERAHAGKQVVLAGRLALDTASPLRVAAARDDPDARVSSVRSRTGSLPGADGRHGHSRFLPVRVRVCPGTCVTKCSAKKIMIALNVMIDLAALVFEEFHSVLSNVSGHLPVIPFTKDIENRFPV